MPYGFRGRDGRLHGLGVLDGLGAAYSVPGSVIQMSDGRWYTTFTNPNGTTTRFFSNVDFPSFLKSDSNFVSPPASVWQSLGIQVAEGASALTQQQTTFAAQSDNTAAIAAAALLKQQQAQQAAALAQQQAAALVQQQAQQQAATVAQQAAAVAQQTAATAPVTSSAVPEPAYTAPMVVPAPASVVSVLTPAPASPSPSSSMPVASGFDFSAVPWWGWAAGAGVLFFMFGKKGR